MNYHMNENKLGIQVYIKDVLAYLPQLLLDVEGDVCYHIEA